MVQQNAIIVPILKTEEKGSLKKLTSFLDIQIKVLEVEFKPRAPYSEATLSISMLY